MQPLTQPHLKKLIYKMENENELDMFNNLPVFAFEDCDLTFKLMINDSLVQGYSNCGPLSGLQGWFLWTPQLFEYVSEIFVTWISAAFDKTYTKPLYAYYLAYSLTVCRLMQLFIDVFSFPSSNCSYQIFWSSNMVWPSLLSNKYY